MSVNRCSVGKLKHILSQYSDDLNVVVMRDPNFAVSKYNEFDGIRHHKLMDMNEYWDVYVPSEVKGEGEEVLVLSATDLTELRNYK